MFLLNASKKLSIYFGIWLSLIFPISIISKIYLHGIQVHAMMILGIIWPLLVFVKSKTVLSFSSLSMSQIVFFIIYIFFSALSIFYSVVPFQSVIYLILTILIFAIIVFFSSNIDKSHIDSSLKIFVFLMFLFVLVFAIYDYRPGVRLGQGVDIENSNAIGMVAFSVSVVSFIYRSFFIRLFFLVPMSVVVILTGSRASAISMLIGFLVIFFYDFKKSNRFSKLIYIFTFLFFIAVLIFNFDFYWQAINNFFEFDSYHRGINSGASGRTVAWLEVWNIFLSNPVFGVGFRAHEYILKTSTSAHNGYLSLLVEIGLIGLLSALIFSIIGLCRLYSMAQNDNLSRYPFVLMGLSFGYLFLCMFERYFFNFGNPASVMFLFAIMLPYKNFNNFF